MLPTDVSPCSGNAADHLAGTAKLDPPVTVMMEAKAENTFDNGWVQAVGQTLAMQRLYGCATHCQVFPLI